MPPIAKADSYAVTAGQPVYAGRIGTPPVAGRAITALQITSIDTALQSSSPVTFGHSFVAGDWVPGAHDLYARVEGSGAAVPIQTDATSLHADGSVRYAVVSIDAGSLAAGQSKSIELFTDTKRAPYAATLSAPNVNLVAEATIYGVQQTQISCGVQGGGAYAIGEVLTLRFVLGGSTYDYSVTITSQMAENASVGGAFLKVAEAMAAAISAGGVFVALRIGDGQGYEKLWVEPAATNAGAFTTTVIYAGAASVTHANLSTYAAPIVWTATAQTTLASQIAESNAGTIPQHQRRIYGPVATEFRQTVKFKDPSNNDHPYLTAFFDTRLYDNGSRVWTDVIVENTGLMAANPASINYKLDIKIDGAVVHTEPRFWHYARTRWHKAVWKGTNPQLRVTKDLPYFLRSRAVLNYRQDITPNAAALNSLVANVNADKAAKAYFGPMADILIAAYFPMTGGRGELAPLPEWAVGYVLTQDDRAKYATLAVADSSAAVGIHFRDEVTGWPCGLDTRPTLGVGIAGTVPTSSQPTHWTADTAHQASYSYIPYLFTGDAFYLDELMFWASWNLTTGSPGYRFTEGVGALVDNQVRGQAWTMRALAECTWMLPSWHPRRAYYRAQLDANLAWFNTNKGGVWAPNPLRAILRGEGDCPPWQGDFFGCIMSLLAENGEPNAMSILNHIGDFIVGRVLADEQGFCAALAAAYSTFVRADGQTGAWLQNWAEYAQKNNPGEYGQACNTLSVIGDAAFATGYAAVLRAALAAAANAGHANGQAAYTKYAAMTPGVAADQQNNRGYAIVPR